MYNPDKFRRNSAAQLPSADVLSVSSLNKLARSLLETNFPNVVVEGEISNLARPSSGHCYLTLKDKSAQVRCAMFSNRNRFLRFQPENGQQIVVRGKLSIYEGRGDYQLIIESMELAGDGALQRAFEELKSQLQDEGLFKADAKKEIGTGYRHIGLITSATGAAVRDMITVFERRFPATRLTVLPVAVQGKEAAGEIARAIHLANKLSGSLHLEALIVGRGGGSLEDLQAFNDESVARAIFASKLPITSAVGHEVDFTIADFVADLRAPTPSAAAELMSPSQQEMLASFQGFQILLRQLINARIQQLSQNVDWLSRQLKHPDRRLQEHLRNLAQLTKRLQRNMSSRFQQQRNSLIGAQRSLKSNSPARRVAQARELALSISKRMEQAMSSTLKDNRASLSSLSRSLNNISPLNTLARGYSITFDESLRVIRAIDDIEIGSTLISQIEGGRISSTVESITPSSQEDKD
ncbi:MAG: exodeoxyribonuclease VII large subunit [Pseudohongiellaceae bacterium]|jgi:exodeoxyribonuclease VII large subunit